MAAMNINNEMFQEMVQDVTEENPLFWVYYGQTKERS